MKHTVDCQYFPGWVRKAITFTIDDGNVPLDRKFLALTAPAGLRGTFNLSTPLEHLSPEGYRKFYDGYEISNHCSRHAYPLTPKTDKPLKNEPFDEKTADPAYTYPTDEADIRRVRTWGWTYLAATDERYLDCVDIAQKELESVFGEGKIRDYVWPNGEQDNPRVLQMLIDYGFRSLRKTGCVEDSTNFALPADRMHWSYNANYKDMTEVAAKYDAYPDDGRLKFFCFGVHSHDFENAGRWDVLEDFCRKYGNRPEDFWYASVGDIFDYEDAVKSVRITDEGIENPSDVDLAVTVDGVRKTLGARSQIKF